MYDSNQHAYYAACKYLGLDNNIELANEDLDKIYELIKKTLIIMLVELMI
ncbi:MAG: hypothetical protein L6U99_11260 [Clostridium sp.]|nr:MAG: hypothetical protein L6U99_11260 [Clostridium sp.]